MDLDELFHHALNSLPDAAGELLRAQRDPTDFVFTSLDGASELGITLIASDLAVELGVDARSARTDVARMITAATSRGEELVVSLMISKDVLGRLLAASHIDTPTRIAMRVWLEGPLARGQYRVVAIANDQVRAAAVDSELEREAEPVPASMLN